jgi:hypothetical protein
VVLAISKKVNENQSLGGVYRYTDSAVAVMITSNMLVMVEALGIECQSLIKIELGLAWLRLWSLFGVSVCEPVPT